MGDRLEIADKADVPHVPGVEVAVFERGDLRHHEHQGPHQDRGYPVEYRTFVRNGSVRAVSVHYIQQPLRRNDADLRPAAAR